MEIGPFQLFIDLIKFDQKILDLKNSVEKFEKSNTDIINEIASLKNNLEAANLELIESKKQVDANELRMQELDQAEKEKKAKLDLISNPKEYQALKKELEKAQLEQVNLEPILISNWNKYENIKKDNIIKTEKLKKQIEELEEKHNKNSEEIKKIQNDLDTLIQQRPEKEKDVPQEWLEKYYVMREKVKNPVVPIINSSCSACFYNMTSQDRINLDKKRLIQCKGCFRLIYNPEKLSEATINF